MARNAVAHEVRRPEDDFILSAGAYYFMRYPNEAEPCGIVHGCPCGCGMQSALWFKGRSHAGAPEWDVAGEWPKVTLSPSIGIVKDRGTGRFHWHGYLRNGVFEEI